MKKLIGYTFILSLISTIAFAGVYCGSPNTTIIDNYSDVTLFSRMENVVMGGADYTQGDYIGSLGEGATISATAVKYGTYGLLCDANWRRLILSVYSEDIVNGTKGRVGFWVYYATALTTGTGLLSLNGTSVSFTLQSNDSGTLSTSWIDASNTRTHSGNSGDISISTWHFIEVEWDTTADTIKVWVNNNLKLTETETILPITITSLSFGRYSGSGGTIYIDNVMVSDLSKARNFYTDTKEGTALKDLTTTPRIDSRGLLGWRYWTGAGSTYYGDSIAGITDTPETVGTVSYAHCEGSWIKDGTIVVGLYDNTNALVAYGSYSFTHTSDPQNVNIPLNITYTLTNQTYYLAVSMPSDTDWSMSSTSIGETNSKYIDTGIGWSSPPASTFEGFDGDKDTRYLVVWVDDHATML